MPNPRRLKGAKVAKVADKAKVAKGANVGRQQVSPPELARQLLKPAQVWLRVRQPNRRFYWRMGLSVRRCFWI